jgi:tripartite-type tricarboxylate transporter receptor subunit TctC
MIVSSYRVTEGCVMIKGLLIAAAAIAFATPASAQFFKGKTLTVMVNYGAGGNVDTEARILARDLPRHVAGNPTVIIQNMPGAGGLHAMNLLGLNIKSKADGLTAGCSPSARPRR